MGPFNNETGRYEPSPDFENGDWYIDSSLGLYIVPQGVAETEGPDGEVVAALNEIYRHAKATGPGCTGGRAVTQNVEAKLGLEFVHQTLRRFSTAIGYFTA